MSRPWRSLTLLRLKLGSKEGSLDRWPKADPSHFPSQAPSGSSFPKPADCLLAQDLCWELLASGMATLPGSREGLEAVEVEWPNGAGVHCFLPIGTRDVQGRAVLLLCAHSPAWLQPECSSQELIRLLLYLRSIPRFEGGGWETEPEPAVRTGSQVLN